MQLKALTSWYNGDHEGQVAEGQIFEAGEYRAGELIRAGLAMAFVDEHRKITVPADPPAHPPVAHPPAHHRTKRRE